MHSRKHEPIVHGGGGKNSFVTFDRKSLVLMSSGLGLASTEDPFLREGGSAMGPCMEEVQGMLWRPSLGIL